MSAPYPSVSCPQRTLDLCWCSKPWGKYLHLSARFSQPHEATCFGTQKHVCPSAVMPS